MAYHISIAENDDYGTPKGWAERIEIEGLTLENTVDNAYTPRVAFDGRKLHVGRFSCAASQQMSVGNIYWNLYAVSWSDAKEIINYLMKSKHWACTEGPSDQYEKFQAKIPFTFEDMQSIREVST